MGSKTKSHLYKPIMIVEGRGGRQLTFPLKLTAEKIVCNFGRWRRHTSCPALQCRGTYVGASGARPPRSEKETKRKGKINSLHLPYGQQISCYIKSKLINERQNIINYIKVLKTHDEYTCKSCKYIILCVSIVSIHHSPFLQGGVASSSRITVL